MGAGGGKSAGVRNEMLEVVEKARRNGADETRIKGLERMLAHECAAEELEKCLQNGSAKDLKAAIARATRAGVEKKVLAASRTHLMQMEAGDMLQKAVERGDPELMAQAIMHAKAAGFAQAELDAAEELRVQIEATQVIRAAMSTRCPDAIRYAIKVSRDAKGQAKDIKAAERLLEQLSAGRDLTQALSRKSAGGRESLKEVFDKAVDLGVTGAEVQRAKAALDNFDASVMLKESLKTGNALVIGKALEAAKAAGVDQKELTAGTRRLEDAERNITDADRAAATATPVGRSRRTICVVAPSDLAGLAGEEPGDGESDAALTPSGGEAPAKRKNRRSSV